MYQLPLSARAWPGEANDAPSSDVKHWAWSIAAFDLDGDVAGAAADEETALAGVARLIGMIERSLTRESSVNAVMFDWVVAMAPRK